MIRMLYSQGRGARFSGLGSGGPKLFLLPPPSGPSLSLSSSFSSVVLVEAGGYGPLGHAAPPLVTAMRCRFVRAI